MKKLLYLLLVTTLCACNDGKQTSKPVTDTVSSGVPGIPSAPARQYSNERFRQVTVEKTGENQYLIEGEGQIFEANFGWVVEDGHNELLKGHNMTDAGAPEWGKFRFSIEVEKERPNSTLMLILFETSAEDGRRVHELPIALP